MAFSPEQALDYLAKAHRDGRLPHTFLFTGPEGSGKRELVKQFFNLVNGSSAHQSDLHQVEPESKSRRIVVDQIRELENALRMRSGQSDLKFGVIVEADRMMPQAANAFLKTLEEPPGHSILILVTALPGALLDTIVSRCIRVPLRDPASRKLTPEEVDLLDEFTETVLENGFTVLSALRLVTVFQNALIRSKERIETEHQSLFKQEQATYKQATDGTWLGQREEYFTVLTESRYQKARTNLVGKVVEWFGDALRIQQSSAALDLPAYRPQAERLARLVSSTELMKRLEAVHSLNGYLARNIQERMAIEVAFLRALAPDILSRPELVRVPSA